MEAVIRGSIVYLFLLLIFRLSGKRTLSEASSFDLVLLLIISETVQQALINSDSSMTNAAILIVTLIFLDIVLSVLKQKFPALDAVLDGMPRVLVRDGQPLHDRMDKERVDENDLLEAAREQQGLETIEQIKYAVLERGGKITIVPK